MASINIDSDLRLVGSELFIDSESYLKELSADEQINTVGGIVTPYTTITIPITFTIAGTIIVYTTSK